ncbi:MAG: hypothetical protein ACK2TV_11060, partial [Anaerolineales bacterium]
MNTRKQIAIYLILPLLILSTLFTLGIFPLGVNAVEAIQSDNFISNSASNMSRVSSETVIPVPEVCIDGFCKLLLYKDAAIGAYGPGYVWEVYYLQFSDGDGWIGGPNVCLGGFCYNDGQGINGNGLSEGVILGGVTPDGGYIRILDDGESENDPNHWTVELQSSPSLTQVFLQACPITGCTWETVSENTIIPVPDFCDSEYSEFCLITRYTDGTFGAFGPGFSLPAYFDGDVEGSDNE